MGDRHAELLGAARFLERDGCRVGYRVAGDGTATLLLFSAWQIVHSAAWKGQVPYLSRFHRVISVDCRGNGLSDRPNETSAYSPWELIADAEAILDREAVKRAVVCGFSYGGHLAALFAATRPERCAGAVLMAPTAPFGPSNPAFTPENVLAERAQYEGWQKYSFACWRRDYDDFAAFFIRQVFPEPHSEKQVEDSLGWARETDAETLIRTIMARRDTAGQREDAYRRIACPVLVIQGTEDRVVPHEKGVLVATITGARLESLAGSGHMPTARIPAKVNRLIRSFVEELGLAPADDALAAPAVLQRRPGRAPRALYLSSPIGLGHVRRDKAVADALRGLCSELAIDWLAQDPVTRFLEATGERVHPASRRLLSEARHIEREAGAHELHAFEALRRMDAILAANFCHFQDLVDDGGYDLVIADEAWEVDRFWHEHPELKRAPLAWMTDFVGVLPMAGPESREARLAADWNAEMIEFVERRSDIRDVALFIGEAEDVVDLPFAPDLPSIRDWTLGHYGFPGYIDPTEALRSADRAAVRRALGYGSDELVCLVAVGGSGIGESLLRRLMALAPELARHIPALRLEVVTGPRIDPARLPRIDGVGLHAFVVDLPGRLLACDVAIVQGGLSTCMELTCLGKPFLYVPLENHFEQQIHVHHRLQRYGLGQRLGFAELDRPDRLAERLLRSISGKVPGTALRVRPGGAERAAALIARLL